MGKIKDALIEEPPVMEEKPKRISKAKIEQKPKRISKAKIEQKLTDMYAARDQSIANHNAILGRCIELEDMLQNWELFTE